MTDSEKWAEKIQKLLRKAEDPKISQEEADAFFTKAQELMTRYAIDEAMIASTVGGQIENIIRSEINYHSIYSRALFYIGAAVARSNDCKVLIRKGKDLMRTDCVIIGFESDVRRVEMLNASLQIQVMQAVQRFWDNFPNKHRYRTERERFKVRRQFIFSFAGGLETQLEEARRKIVEEAETEYAGENSVALALRSKSDRVDEWMEQEYGGKLRKTKGKGFAGGGDQARMAGHQAGRNASLDTPNVRGNQVGGPKRQLTR